MTARRLAAGLGAAVVLASAPALAQRFRVGIDIVSLNVTVTGADGRYVTDLGKDDFQVYEDGIQQTVSFFSHSQLPIALALLLDTSASMEEKLGTAQAAAIGFAHRLRPDDVAEVIDFDSRVEILQPFTNDVKALEDAIHKTTAGGSTSLYNALYISLKELRKVQARAPDEIRRQAVVVLSDGEDTSSLIGYDEVLDLAKRSETGIYAIGLRSPRRGAGRGVPRGGVRAAAARAGDGRPGVLSLDRGRAAGDLRPDLRGAGEPVPRSATPPRTPAATACGGASW